MEKEAPDEVGAHTIAQNLAESSISDVLLSDLRFDLGSLALSYMDHRGKPELRELVAADGDGLAADDVLITAGASVALFIVATSLLDRESRAVVAFPNYVTNFDTPRTIGCDLALLELKFEENYDVDVARLATLITPATRLVSVTTPHNPTGAAMTEAQFRRTIELVEQSNAYLLVDETYRDMMAGPNAAARGVVVVARDQRVVRLQSVRSPGPEDRVARLPGSGAAGDAARREGTNLHLQFDPYRRAGISVPERPIDASAAHPAPHRRGTSQSCVAGLPGNAASSGSNRAAASSAFRESSRMPRSTRRASMMCFATGTASPSGRGTGLKSIRGTCGLDSDIRRLTSSMQAFDRSGRARRCSRRVKGVAS